MLTGQEDGTEGPAVDTETIQTIEGVYHGIYVSEIPSHNLTMGFDINKSCTDLSLLLQRFFSQASACVCLSSFHQLTATIETIVNTNEHAIQHGSVGMRI